MAGTLLRRHEIAAFFALALLIGWSPWWAAGEGFAGGVSVAGLIVLAVVQAAPS